MILRRIPVAALAGLLVAHCAPSTDEIPGTEGWTGEPQVAARIEQARQQVLGDPRSAAAVGHLGRVFQAHDRRRIVLATNVAETSVTVPGIRSVVDVGTARISRYSNRTKVQRLPIEPVSQASADQRAGRCGPMASPYRLLRTGKSAISET